MAKIIYDHNTVEVNSRAELTTWIARVTEEAKRDNISVSISLQMDDDTGLAFAVGTDVSSVRFFEGSGANLRQHVVCDSPWWEDDETEIEMYFGAVPSLVPKYLCVHIQDAIEAAYEYWDTGKMPKIFC
jgi:hypothetical protein